MKLLGLMPWAYGVFSLVLPPVARELDDEFVIVDGWILKKSEAIELFE